MEFYRNMQKILVLLIIIVVLLLASEVYEQYNKKYSHERIYNEAEKSSRILGRPLMILGDPYKIMRKSICGNICIDMDGCPKCQVSVKGRMEDILPTMKADSHVIFVSCVLEYVDDIDKVWKELIRIAGTINNIYVIPTGFCSRMPEYKTKRIIKGVIDGKLDFTTV
jgi:hypothetical protein